MKQNDQNEPQKSPGKPIGPRHTYEDRPGETRPTVDPEHRPSASPGRGPSQPRTTEEPIKPLPDYGDTEPGDPRRDSTSGGERGGSQPGDAQDVGGGGPSSTLQG